MYLVEDRIIGFSIITNKDRNDTVAYAPGAVARTVPPDSLQKLMKQRRKWINASRFASLYALKNYCNIWKTRHDTKEVFNYYIVCVLYV